MSLPSSICLDDFHSFGLPQTASKLWVVDDLKQLSQLQQQTSQLPYWLGEGANTIFVEHIARPILKLAANQVRLNESGGEILCYAEAGKDWSQLVVELTEQGIGGLENLALIPGTVGAAPVQNIGAYGVEFADVCDFVDIFDWRTGQTRRLQKSDCQFGYRDSIFKTEQANHWLIIGAGIKLTKQWQPKLNYQGLDELANEAGLTPMQVMQRVISIRQQKLPSPSDVGNAGSFFKNPTVSQQQADELGAIYPAMPHFKVPDGVKIPAAWLIDQLGWKGKGVGGASVHREQALVIVNANQANVSDVIALAYQIKQQVRAKYQIEITPEVRFLGAQHELTLEQAYAKACV